MARTSAIRLPRHTTSDPEKVPLYRPTCPFLTLTLTSTIVVLSGVFQVPTTLNSGSVDRQKWKALGVSPALGDPASALGDAYLALGVNGQAVTHHHRARARVRVCEGGGSNMFAMN